MTLLSVGCLAIAAVISSVYEGDHSVKRVRMIFFYCNRDGLFRQDIVKGIDDKQSGYRDIQERRE